MTRPIPPVTFTRAKITAKPSRFTPMQRAEVWGTIMRALIIRAPAHWPLARVPQFIMSSPLTLMVLRSAVPGVVGLCMPDLPDGPSRIGPTRSTVGPGLDWWALMRPVPLIPDIARPIRLPV